MKRRTYLATASTALCVAAGCLGDAQPTEGGDHRATTSFEGAPVLGTDPEDADSLVVAFEDPSCGICASFHQSTLPELQDDPIGEDVAFVYRAFPIRPYAWGDLAAEAIVATTDHEQDTAWDLLNYYYTNQSDLDDDNVLDRTESVLADQTMVDGADVVTDVESGAYADVVDATVDDGEEAGASTTPTFFLFTDGEFVTEITGNQDADVFRNALEQ